MFEFFIRKGGENVLVIYAGQRPDALEAPGEKPALLAEGVRAEQD
jgi:hypothetical protein